MLNKNFSKQFKMKKIVMGAMALIALSSCVSQKKYMIAESGRLDALSQVAALEGKLEECYGNSDQLSQRLTRLLKDTTLLGSELRNYKSLLNSNLGEQDKLNALLGQKMKELEEREQTINELQDMIASQQRRVQEILGSVKDALLGFSNDELTISEKDGKIYIAMSDKLLFSSGSAKVDKRGEQALAQLAEVLNKQTDIDIAIEGHTDSKPIHTAQFSDNWDLSVIRATSVVRILTQKYNVNPLQIQPSGRGEFMPVADNESAEGRAKNRRTEIIIAPKLDKLYQILQQ